MTELEADSYLTEVQGGWDQAQNGLDWGEYPVNNTTGSARNAIVSHYSQMTSCSMTALTYDRNSDPSYDHKLRTTYISSQDKQY